MTAMALVVTLVCCMRIVAADPVAVPKSASTHTKSSEPFLLAPPKEEGPVVVQTRFDLYDINEINIGEETFEFTGVLTLKWHDTRQAFDPVAAGVVEKIFQGSYQFDEISPGWYPQIALLNESGLYESSGIILRVRPDGTSTLIQTLNANAESEVNMSRFPFDSHRLEAVFEVLGFDKDEVLLKVDPYEDKSAASEVRIPQWTVEGISASVRDRNTSYAGYSGVSSAFVLSVDVKRLPFYAMRLVIFPLIVIVLLSFSVFWTGWTGRRWETGSVSRS